MWARPKFTCPANCRNPRWLGGSWAPHPSNETCCFCFASRRVPLRWPLSVSFRSIEVGVIPHQVPTTGAPDTEVRFWKDAALAQDGIQGHGWYVGRRKRHRTTASWAPSLRFASLRAKSHHMPERMWLRSNNYPAWKGALTGLGAPGSTVFPAQYAARVQVPLPCPLQALQYYHRSKKRHGSARKGPAANQPHTHHPAISQHLPYRVRGVLARASATLQDLPPTPTENSAPADLSPRPSDFR